MSIRVELREVTEQLEQVEVEIAQLLEKQSQLSRKKQQLERAIKSEASTAASSDKWEKTDFPWNAQLQQLKRDVFHVDRFRHLQLQTMNATLSGKDCILIMPTGGGKSLCFQLPALVSKGITLVVSPLVSLMEDQLYSLEQLGVDAALLNASSTKEQVNRVHAAMTDKKATLKMLYVTPEKLAKSKRFMSKVEKMYSMGLLARLVIDEVHCCSQWGHDFRPDYKFLGIMKKQFPTVPILGLTATATSSVLEDVKKILQIQGCLLFKASFNRHNLFYEVRTKPSSMKDSLDEMRDLISSRFRGQSGIIYCFSQKDTEEVSRELQSRGIRSGAYHSNSLNRSKLHKQWIQNQIQVIVATIAFGMGIDKPDVRFVIHYSVSKSMENYYQESGRAGRDDQKSVCILYASFADVFRQSTMVFTEQTGLEKLYNMITYAYDHNKCRRTLIARHFGEVWDSSKCNEMCDHCKNKTKEETCRENVSQYARDLVALLRNCKGKDQRVTGLKLLDVWMGKGNVNLRLSNIKPPKLSRSTAERVMIYLLVNGYLREDFHFTPYSTISYILPGSRSAALDNGGHTVEMTFTRPKSTSSSSTPTGQNKKSVKPVVINPQNSKFTTITATAEEKAPTPPKKKPAKRKPIIESDDDSDLDFGQSKEQVPKKSKFAKENLAKLKRSKTSSSSTAAAKESICIDSDSDLEEGIMNGGKHLEGDIMNHVANGRGDGNESSGKNSVARSAGAKAGTSSSSVLSTGMEDYVDEEKLLEEEFERKYMQELQDREWSD